MLDTTDSSSDVSTGNSPCHSQMLHHQAAHLRGPSPQSASQESSPPFDGLKPTSTRSSPSERETQTTARASSLPAASGVEAFAPSEASEAAAATAIRAASAAEAEALRCEDLDGDSDTDDEDDAEVYDTSDETAEGCTKGFQQKSKYEAFREFSVDVASPLSPSFFLWNALLFVSLAFCANALCLASL
ncbi:hypothetical protein cyc_07762 [Cyclospora cayetanensis]|uniref:Transmembrane protein n=1 Tax=Cyclospora cayetanensis TaxID=88456 RepID=A0A1D3D1R0_9EIME|nr:hypothetical protein cyc_07762 [Cyclospora cayetanensis]